MHDRSLALRRVSLSPTGTRRFQPSARRPELTVGASPGRFAFAAVAVLVSAGVGRARSHGVTMDRLVVGVAIMLVAWSAAAALLPPAVSRAVVRIVAGVVTVGVLALAVVASPPWVRISLVAAALVVGACFFIIDWRRRTAEEREARARARLAAAQHVRRRAPPPAPHGSRTP